MRRRSKGELSNGNGIPTIGGHSLDRRTYDPTTDKSSLRKEDMLEY
jgi:hypothetical protein